MKRLVALTIVALSVCVLAVCTSEKPSSPLGTGTELVLSMAQSSLASKVEIVLLRAYSDTDTLLVDSTGVADGAFDFGLIHIPAGRAHLVIAGLDAERTVIYSADTVVRIESGANSQLAIRLEPAVPMIKLTPFFRTAQTGQTFVTSLEIHNINRLYAAKLKIAIDRGMALFDQLMDVSGSAVVDAEKTAYVNGDTVEVHIQRPDGADDHIDSDLHVLADLRFYAIGPGRLDISLVADSLVTTDGGIDTSTIYFDGQVVELTGAVTDSSINIPDSNFEWAVREALNKPTGPLFASELATLDSLDARTRMIRDISGAEYMRNLESAVFWENEIGDLSPLSALSELKGLYLGLNYVNDLSPLASLSNLVELDFNHNHVQDISVIANFPRLRLLTGKFADIVDLSAFNSLDSIEVIDLERNQITDISPLSGCTMLRDLLLRDNFVADLTPLTNLTGLTVLDLGNNMVEDIQVLSTLANLHILDLFSNDVIDIEPLVLNTGLDFGDTVYLDRNPLSQTSLLEHIPALKARGVEVFHSLDSLPPYPITDLQADSVTAYKARLIWSAPSDQGDFPRVFEYEIRYHTDSVTVASWIDAELATNDPVPQEPGYQETVWIDGLSPGTEYYFAIKSVDIAGNWSELSVVAFAVTMPPP